jgi:hypothetical protein
MKKVLVADVPQMDARALARARYDLAALGDDAAGEGTLRAAAESLVRG